MRSVRVGSVPATTRLPEEGGRRFAQRTGLHALRQSIAGYLVRLHRLHDLPRKHFLNGNGFEFVALPFPLKKSDVSA